MICLLPWEMLSLRNKLNLKLFFLVMEAISYTTGTGTKGITGNEWNQNQVPPQQQWPQTKGAPLGGWDDDVSNPQGRFPGQNPMWKLEDSIPGVPGQSYPNFGKIPDTSFDCRNQIEPGYYADIEAKCQVFHICQTDGRQNSFLCPVGTLFNQKSFTCDWWFNVICTEASMHYSRNENLYKSPHIGIDGFKVNSYGVHQRSHVQQPSVGISDTPTSSKGGNWNQQDSSPRIWQENQDRNKKGDNKPMIQRGGHRRQNWQNKGSGNTNVGRGNFAKGQSGSRRTNQGQQRGRQNEKGWNSRGSMDRGWRQNGGSIPNTQLFNQQGGTKGGKQPNLGRNQFKGQNRRNTNIRQMDPNRNKGVNTNTWSIRARNFQVSSEDRKSSSSEVWPNNNNADIEFRREIYEPHKIKGPDSTASFSNAINEEQFENKNFYNEWNYASENANNWEENNQAQRTQSYGNDYDYNYDYS